MVQLAVTKPITRFDEGLPRDLADDTIDVEPGTLLKSSNRAIGTCLEAARRIFAARKTKRDQAALEVLDRRSAVSDRERQLHQMRNPARRIA